MRYHAVIELRYVGDEPVSEIGTVLTTALADVPDLNPDVVFTRPTTSWKPDNTLTLSATIAGLALTGPLEAIRLLDEALDRSLMGTGLFERFDVAHKTLTVGPAEPVP